MIKFEMGAWCIWYGFLNIELAETQLGLLKGNKPNEHMNLWLSLKWVRSERYGLLHIELAWMWWGFLRDNKHSEHTSLWKKNEVCAGWAIWTFEYWIRLFKGNEHSEYTNLGKTEVDVR